MNKEYTAEELSVIATQIRLDTIQAIYAAGSGHPGGSLSIAEILAVLYFREMNVDPYDPAAENRDRFVLSKGHAAPALYAALAERGYFPREELESLRNINSRLQGHPDMKHIPGVDMSTGSLGQGLSAACGMALYAQLNRKSFRVYAIVGDGELKEGLIWEAAMSAGHHALNNLTVYLDRNGLQIDGKVSDVMDVEPVAEKFAAFGWNVTSVDGHNIGSLIQATEWAKRSVDKPTLILCKTLKGKGVSFMENQVAWHGSPLNQDQYTLAMTELHETLRRNGG